MLNIVREVNYDAIVGSVMVLLVFVELLSDSDDFLENYDQGY